MKLFDGESDKLMGRQKPQPTTGVESDGDAQGIDSNVGEGLKCNEKTGGGVRPKVPINSGGG